MEQEVRYGEKAVYAGVQAWWVELATIGGFGVVAGNKILLKAMDGHLEWVLGKLTAG